MSSSDKSPTDDTDGDGVVDACDLDSDNDGILDTEEDTTRNGLYRDDDNDGDTLLVGTAALDKVFNYLDLDSDSDGMLDLFEGRTLTRTQIDAWDQDRNGIFDPSLDYGCNGLLDDLETAPDSGVLAAPVASLRHENLQGQPNFVNLISIPGAYDFESSNASPDDDAGGFLAAAPTVTTDPDRDGIMLPVDTAPGGRGAPGSPVWPSIAP